MMRLAPTNLPLFMFFVVVLFALANGGCNKRYYLVRSGFRASIPEPEPPLLVKSRSYDVGSPQSKVVALRPPDYCVDDTTSEATGMTSHGRTIAQTKCGVQMAQLERAFISRGYRVISWTVLRDHGLKKAGNLGVQVLFRINSFEEVVMEPPRDSRFERVFYTSSWRGNKIRRTAVPCKIASRLKLLMRDYEDEMRARVKRMGVTLDASATWLETGETVWAYRMSHYEKMREIEDRELLVVCNEEPVCSVVPRSKNQPSVPSGQCAGGSEALSRGGITIASEERFLYFRLTRTAMDLLVSAFVGD